MTTDKQTQIIAEQGKQELFIIREFDAPQERVFQAFSTSAMLEQFFAPENRVMKFDYSDFASNGKYRYSVTTQEGKLLCTFKGVIHEVASPERIIQTSEMEGLPFPGNVVLEKMSFEVLPDNRTKLTIHDVCLNVQTRDAIIASGMAEGLKSIFKQLDVLLTKK
jgi:uncharacterized protein YndB with AHSA1/START domain